MPVYRLQDKLQDIPQNHSFVVDTNIIIGCFSSDNDSVGKIGQLINTLVQNKNCKMYYFVATRLELYYYFLRREMTTFLKKYVGQNRSKITAFEQLLMDYCNAPNIKLFDDAKIKKLRNSCVGCTVPNGLEKWKEIVRKATKRLPHILQSLQEANFVYANKDNPIISNAARLEWDDVETLMQATAIGSNDAAIINMFKASTLKDIISNDSDFGFVEKFGLLNNKTVFTI